MASSEGPAPGMSFQGVPVIKESEKGGVELFQAAKACIPEDPPLEDTKPDLNLVDPGRMDRCIDKVKAPPMPDVEGLPSVAVMDVEVVPDHVNRPDRVAFGHGFHEGQEIGLSSLSTTVAKDTSRPRLEGREQGSRAMAPIFKLKASRVTPARALRREPAFQGLNARLLIDTKNRGSLWRFQIELTDSLDFRLELRIRAMEPHSQTMRAQ